MTPLLTAAARSHCCWPPSPIPALQGRPSTPRRPPFLQGLAEKMTFTSIQTGKSFLRRQCKVQHPEIHLKPACPLLTCAARLFALQARPLATACSGTA